MDKLTQYRSYVQDILQTLASYKSVNSTLEMQTIFDIEHNHYQLVRVGWVNDEENGYSNLVHVDIKEGKFWIQRDMTDVGVADKLVEMGVPKQDIVLGFQAPYKRPLTEFAVS
jgi:hypothetical protein